MSHLSYYTQTVCVMTCVNIGLTGTLVVWEVTIISGEYSFKYCKLLNIQLRIKVINMELKQMMFLLHYKLYT